MAFRDPDLFLVTLGEMQSLRALELIAVREVPQELLQHLPTGLHSLELDLCDFAGVEWSEDFALNLNDLEHLAELKVCRLLAYCGDGRALPVDNERWDDVPVEEDRWDDDEPEKPVEEVHLPVHCHRLPPSLTHLHLKLRGEITPESLPLARLPLLQELAVSVYGGDGVFQLSTLASAGPGLKSVNLFDGSDHNFSEGRIEGSLEVLSQRREAGRCLEYISHLASCRTIN
jgi:hypothetical protein